MFVTDFVYDCHRLCIWLSPTLHCLTKKKFLSPTYPKSLSPSWFVAELTEHQNIIPLLDRWLFDLQPISNTFSRSSSSKDFLDSGDRVSEWLRDLLLFPKLAVVSRPSPWEDSASVFFFPLPLPRPRPRLPRQKGRPLLLLGLEDIALSAPPL